MKTMIEFGGNYSSLISTQAEVLLKIRADFSANVTANTITVQMPVPAYTMRSTAVIYLFL